ncbi:MAG: hypothetical protein HYU68_04610, partial [Bacteroidetes bacterium]|nr:hypothetical protein [Bacteroidota bacterium]
KTIKTLKDFGFSSLGLTEDDFLNKENIIQLGYPPNRLDLIMDLSGIDFNTSFAKHIEVMYEGTKINFINLEDLIVNKKASGRLQDLADIEKLEKDIKETEATKSEYHLRFYEQIEKDRNKNDQFLADLNTLSYQKIRNVKPDDVYVGELKPSENLELSNKYPQGITEETTEEGSAVILKRIKVTGKHVDIYEKIFYKWGGKFYTKNGYNITETLWNLESIEK